MFGFVVDHEFVFGFEVLELLDDLEPPLPPKLLLLELDDVGQVDPYQLP